MTWFERWDDHNLTGLFSPDKGKWVQSETFQNRFDNHRPKCPGTVSRTIKDEPGLYMAGLQPYMANQTRFSHMTFSITLYSASECACPYRVVVLRSTLRMRYDGLSNTRDAGYEYFSHDIYRY